MTYETPKGRDISVAPNYRDGCVWLSVGSDPRRCISPDMAKNIANKLDMIAEVTDWDEQGYGHRGLAEELRSMANDVEAAVENREDDE